MKAKVRWKPIGLSAKRWRETAHLKSPQGSGPYSKAPKGPRLRAPHGTAWGQTAPPSRGIPRPADGFPKGSENTS
jgi:hypothetical protein